MSDSTNTKCKDSRDPEDHQKHGAPMERERGRDKSSRNVYSERKGRGQLRGGQQRQGKKDGKHQPTDIWFDRRTVL